MERADREDVALAAGVLVVTQIDAWGPGLFAPNMVGPEWALAWGHGLMAASLALRRRWPFLVFCVVAGTAALMATLFGASEGLSTLLPTLAAVYSVARHGPRHRAVLAAWGTAGLVLVRELQNPDNTSWAETTNAFAWNLTLAAAWLLGSWLRARWLYEAELAEQVRRAERQRAERERRAVAAAAEAERVRIARELHDVVAHGVSVMVLQADAAEALLDRDTEMARVRLEHVRRTGRESLSELRRLLGTMRSADDERLAPQPGLADLESLLAPVRAAGLRVDLAVEGTAVRLAPGLDLAAYRIVQECLTNVLKHASGVSTVDVRVGYCGAHLDLEVHDDGAPVPQPVPALPEGETVVAVGGHGLAGVRERVGMYGGQLRASPEAGGGFRVRVRLPVEAPA